MPRTAAPPRTALTVAAGARKYARPVIVEHGGNQYDAGDPKHPNHGNPDAYYRAWPADTEPLKTLHTALTKAIAIPPMLVPAGGTWNDSAQTVDVPMRTRTTRETEGVLIPPMLIPVEGRDGKQAADVTSPMRTQTARNETGVLIPTFVSELRGGGSTAHTTDDVLATVTASGNHHGLVIPPLVMRNNTGGAEMSTPASEELRTITTGGHQSLLTWGSLYAHDAGVRDIARALPTQTTVQGDALLTAAEWDAVVDDCLFRMLEPHEIHAGMAFTPDYVVLGSKRQRVKQLGNAVTPPAAEVLVAALVECITGEELAA